jgi:EAL domain-containing protein (putative c-di-GMP-specific phosphodiesterase class I)
VKITLMQPAQPNISTCKSCASEGLDIVPFSMAFQPIVDVTTRSVYAYEALVRGPQGESAASVLSTITPETRYLFDQRIRVRSIELAATIGLHKTGARLSINFLPGAVYNPETCLRKTLHAAAAANFPLDALIFEIVEDERIEDTTHLLAIINTYHRHGFRIALDDFGEAFSGPNVLAKVPIDIVKLDAALIHDLHLCPRSQTIVRHTVQMCLALGTLVVGEGIETLDEYACLLDCGVHLMQGFLFARPGFEHLPAVTWPTHAAAA